MSVTVAVLSIVVTITWQSAPGMTSYHVHHPATRMFNSAQLCNDALPTVRANELSKALEEARKRMPRGITHTVNIQSDRCDEFRGVAAGTGI